MKAILTLLYVVLASVSVLAQSWTPQTSNATEDLMGMMMWDAQAGWAGGANGTMVHTTNGGTTWLQQSLPAPDDVNAIFAISQTTVLAACKSNVAGGVMYRTTDGGANWTAATGTFPDRLLDVFFVDPQNGWTVGNTGLVAHTTDGGQSWAAQVSGTTERLLGLFFQNASLGWIAGRNGQLLKTTNGGANWTLVPLGIQYDFNDIFFADATHGWLAEDGGLIFYTTDGGNIWTPVTTPASNGINRVEFADPTHGWAAGDADELYYSADGGLSWTPQTSNLTGEDLTCLSVVNSGLAWVCGTNGSIAKYQGSGTPTIQASFATPGPACPGSTVSFNDASTGSPVSWQWNFGDGSPLSSAQNPTHIFSAAGTYTVSLTVSNANGDQSTFSATVTVTPGPVAAFSISADTICLGTAVFLTDNSTPAPNSWLWNFGDNTSNSVNQNAVHYYSNPGNFTITLVVSSAAGCKDTVSRSVSVIQPNVQITPQDPVICATGDSVLLTATGAVQFVWFPATALSNTTGGTVYASPSVNTTYFVAGTDVNGCKDTGSVDVFISSGAPPTALFFASNNTICSGEPVQFSNQSLQSLSYEWSFQGGSPANSTLSAPVVSYSTPGSWDVQLVAFGCSGNDTLQFNDYITVYPEVVAGFTASADTLFFPADSVVSFMDNSQNAIAWFWDLGNGTTSNSPNMIGIYSIPGVYTVSLSVMGTGGVCADTAFMQITVIGPSTGIRDEVAQLAGIRVYPNPVSGDRFFVETSDPFSGQIELLDMEGKRINRIEIRNEMRTTISAVKLSPGLYFVRLLRHDGVASSKKIWVK